MTCHTCFQVCFSYFCFYLQEHFLQWKLRKYSSFWINLFTHVKREIEMIVMLWDLLVYEMWNASKLVRRLSHYLYSIICCLQKYSFFTWSNLKLQTKFLFCIWNVSLQYLGYCVKVYHALIYVKFHDWISIDLSFTLFYIRSINVCINSQRLLIRSSISNKWIFA